MEETNAVVLNTIAKLLKTYEPSADTKNLVQKAPITLLVGISGAGKDTICRRLLSGGDFESFVSATTRSPRLNQGLPEKNGIDYHFIDLNSALKMLKNGEYIEANIYSGNVYGTTVDEIIKVLKSGKIALTDLEVNGVANYKKISPHVVAIFILPPNYSEWQKRLLKRYGDTGPDPDDMNKRMHTAIEELENALAKDYYHFVVNDDLDKAVHAVDSIAHGNDTFNSKDDEIKQKAKLLLSDLKSHIL